MPCGRIRQRRESLGFALSLDNHHPPSRRKLFPLSIPLALLGKRGKYLSSVGVKPHVEFIKQESEASLLSLQDSPPCYPDPTQDSEVDVQLRSTGPAWPVERQLLLLQRFCQELLEPWAQRGLVLTQAVSCMLSQ